LNFLFKFGSDLSDKKIKLRIPAE